MYTNLNLFLRAEYFAFCKTRFSLRRWTYVIFFTILYWLMWIVIGFGRLLDRLLFRSFLCQEVREPVFIIAPPRSGTTFLQKLMALDEERFVHAKLYQTIFPSVLYQRGLTGLARIDRCTGRMLAQLTVGSEQEFAGTCAEVHKLRSDQRY